MPQIEHVRLPSINCLEIIEGAIEDFGPRLANPTLRAACDFAMLLEEPAACAVRMAAEFPGEEHFIWRSVRALVQDLNGRLTGVGAPPIALPAFGDFLVNVAAASARDQEIGASLDQTATEDNEGTMLGGLREIARFRRDFKVRLAMADDTAPHSASQEDKDLADLKEIISITVAFPQHAEKVFDALRDAFALKGAKAPATVTQDARRDLFIDMVTELLRGETIQ